VARRSPLLTNGHGIGGQFEQQHVEGMPLGDTFVATMQKAWEFQDSVKRQSMSPKEILTKIGVKYDQYQDFQQQDAHEFLRHLLDAMRMEESDVSRPILGDCPSFVCDNIVGTIVTRDITLSFWLVP